MPHSASGSVGKGKFRTIESNVKASLQNPQIMGSDIAELAEKLDSDPALRREFVAIYGTGPDTGNVVDALVSFQRTLVTPGTRGEIEGAVRRSRVNVGTDEGPVRSNDTGQNYPAPPTKRP